MSFFESIVGAGAILCGFCGTFLTFRIQREASYYRQPVADFQSGESKDVYIGLTHFSGAFLLLILGTLSATVFGFLLPLLALAGCVWIRTQPNLVVGGLVGTLILIAAYFWAELIHYGILKNALRNDHREWSRESPVVIGGIAAAVILAVVAYFTVPGAP